jgi:hypothetical protein
MDREEIHHELTSIAAGHMFDYCVKDLPVGIIKDRDEAVVAALEGDPLFRAYAAEIARRSLIVMEQHIQKD